MSATIAASDGGPDRPIRVLDGVLKYRFKSINSCVDSLPSVLAWASGVGIDTKECVVEQEDDGCYVLWSNKPPVIPVRALVSAVKYRENVMECGECR